MNEEFHESDDEALIPFAPSIPRLPALHHVGSKFNGMFRVATYVHFHRYGEPSIRDHFHNDAALAKASLTHPELVVPTPRDPFTASRHSIQGLRQELMANMPTACSAVNPSKKRDAEAAAREAAQNVCSLPSIYVKPLTSNNVGDAAAARGADSSDEELNKEVTRLYSQRVRKSSRRSGRNKVFSMPESKTTAMFLQNAFHLNAVEDSQLVNLLKALRHEELQKRLQYCIRRLKRAVDREEFFQLIRSLFSRKVINAVSSGDELGSMMIAMGSKIPQPPSFAPARSVRGRKSVAIDAPANLTAEALSVNKADTDALFDLLRGDSQLNHVEVRTVVSRLEPVMHGAIVDTGLRLLSTIFDKDSHSVVHGMLSCFEMNILLDLLRRIFAGHPIPEYYEGILVDEDITKKLIKSLDQVNIVLKRNPQGSCTVYILREILKKEFPETIAASTKLQAILRDKMDDISRMMEGIDAKKNEVVDDYAEMEKALYADRDEEDDETGQERRDLSSLIKSMRATAIEKKKAERQIISRETVCDQFMNQHRQASRENTRERWAVKDGLLIKVPDISDLVRAVKKAAQSMA